MSKSFTMAELIARCEELRDEMEEQRDEARAYAEWQRSADGQAHESEWACSTASLEEDAEFFDDEARFFAAIIRQLRPIGRRQRLLVEGSNH